MVGGSEAAVNQPVLGKFYGTLLAASLIYFLLFVLHLAGVL